MTRKRDLEKEKEKINQIYDKEDSKPIDSYIRLYTQVVREISERLKINTNLLKIYISEETNTEKLLRDKKIHHNFKKMQNSSQI